MEEPTADEKRLMAEAPRGTWALVVAVVVLMSLAWLALYVGRFFAQGPVPSRLPG
jgi:hypothetical protein